MSVAIVAVAVGALLVRLRHVRREHQRDVARNINWIIQ